MPQLDTQPREQQVFRRRGRDAFCREPTNGGLLFDASFLSAYTLRKILIPHSTTTMADTSVATANTLSKEATLILSLRFPAPLAGLVDSLNPRQWRGDDGSKTVARCALRATHPDRPRPGRCGGCRRYLSSPKGSSTEWAGSVNQRAPVSVMTMWSSSRTPNSP
jgi:hypothetical protein